MARIRTIKPEFPQSESMGRVSRDARLLFVNLWTICDDHGRTRAHSRMLASLLFPYDEDAGTGVPVWLAELEKEGCIRRYEVDGAQYLQVMQWTKHQKIDRPSKPQFPGIDEAPREESREPRERSSEEGTKEGTKEGKGSSSLRSDSESASEAETGSDDLLGGGNVRQLPADRVVTVVLAAYHEILPRCQHVSVLNPKRVKRIQAADKLARQVCRNQGWDYDADAFWRAYFGQCSKDAWMRGEVPNPRNASWKQNLDVLLEEDRFAKIMDQALSGMEAAA